MSLVEYIVLYRNVREPYILVTEEPSDQVEELADQSILKQRTVISSSQLQEPTQRRGTAGPYI